MVVVVVIVVVIVIIIVIVVIIRFNSLAILGESNKVQLNFN